MNHRSISTKPKLLILSAYDEAGIRRQAEKYSQRFAASSNLIDDAYIDNLSYTLCFRRSQLQWKSYAVISAASELCSLTAGISPAKKSTTEPGLAFVFTGQGAQWPAMGRELVAYPAFEQSLERSQKFLKALGCRWSLREEMFALNNPRIHSPELSQPLSTALQIALLDLLHDFKIYPTAVVGHSSGEIAAAYAAGAISACSAVKLAYHRGALSSAILNDSTQRGSMMSVGLSRESVKPYLKTVGSQLGHCDLTVACINSPKNVTISGNETQIERLRKLLHDDNIFARKLHVRVAYHSPVMQAVVERYGATIEGLRPGSSPAKPVAIFSSVTGNRLEAKELQCPGYWVRNMVSPVVFADALSGMLTMSSQPVRKKLDLSHRKFFQVNLMLEIGPHSALRGPINDIVTSLRQSHTPTYSSLLIRGSPATATVMDVAGALECLGYPVDMRAVNGLQDNPHKHYMTLPDLPEYVFDYSHSYWHESRISNQYRNAHQGKLDLLGKPVTDWNPMEPRWRNHLRLSEMPWIEDHVINGALIYPGAGMLVMAIEAANQLTRTEEDVFGFEIKETSFLRPLMIAPDAEGTETQLAVRIAQESTRPLSAWSDFRLFVNEQSEWLECCRGSIRARYRRRTNEVDGGKEDRERLQACVDFQSSMTRSPHITIDPPTFYRAINESGFGLGSPFHRFTGGMFDGQGRVQGTVQLFQWPQNEYPQDHIIHPTSLDAMFHMAIAAHVRGGSRRMPTYVPTFLRRFFVSKVGLSYPERTETRNSTWLESEDRRGSEFGGFALSTAGDELVVEFDGFRMTKIAEHQEEPAQRQLSEQKLVYHIDYHPDPNLLSPDGATEYCRKQATESCSPFATYLNLLANHNPCLRILAIGIEDENLIDTALQHLSTCDSDGKVIQTRYSLFRIAAPNTTLLEEFKISKERFPATEFQCFNMEKDELSVKDEFDVILVSALTDLSEDVTTRLKTAVKSDGRLFQLRDGNKASKNGYEPHSKPVGVSMPRNGLVYSGITLSASNAKGQAASTIEVYRAASSPVPTMGEQRIVIILDTESTTQRQVSHDLRAFLLFQGMSHIELLSLRDAIETPVDDVFFLVLLEVSQPFLYTISGQDYLRLRALLASARDVLWMNFAGGSDAGNPDYSLIYGLSRALRNERESLNLTILSLESTDTLSENQLHKFNDILRRKHVRPDPSLSDVEFLEIDGEMHIPRAAPAQKSYHELKKRWTGYESGVKTIEESPPLALKIGSVGLLDTLHFEEDETGNLALATDEVEVETEAAGLNFKDCLVALGQIPNAALGQECAGKVRRAGSDTHFQPGDRVILVSRNGAFKTRVKGKAIGALKIPDSLSFSTAATIVAPYGTAWMTIHRLARLQAGESILIHAGAGGTGQAAIQIAQSVGATIYLTVSSVAKKHLLMDAYNIPESHIFYSRDTSFASGIKCITSGRGVDVVLNSLNGDELVASWECIAPYGRFVEIGKRDIMDNSGLPMYPFRKNVSFHSFDGALWFQEQPEDLRADLEKVVKLFSDGKLQPPRPLQVVDISQCKKAFRDLQEGQIAGKIVLEITPQSRVEVCHFPSISTNFTDYALQAKLKVRSTFTTSESATFVIAGGLGGLGRATARWLVARGARNLILLSRFGTRTDVARELIVELRAQCVRVETPACDITDLQALKRTINGLLATMPPIKGAFQMSIVQRVSHLQSTLCAHASSPFPRTSYLQISHMRTGSLLSIARRSVPGICTPRSHPVWTSSLSCLQDRDSRAYAVKQTITQETPTRML